MHLPFTVTIKRSGRDDLRHPGFWLSTGIIILTVAGGAVLLRAHWPGTASKVAADATLVVMEATGN